MRIAVVGLGAIGTHLAAHLAALPSVTVSALVRKGGPDLLPVSAEVPGGVRRGDIRVSASADDLGAQDAVFYTVKTPQLRDAAQRGAALRGPETVLVPPTSTIPYWYFHGLGGSGEGTAELDPSGELARWLPPSSVLGCAFWVGATVLRRGHVLQEGEIAGYPLGEPDGSRSERALRLSACMAEAGLRAPVRADIRSEIWMKLINSLCWNTVAVLTQAEMSLMGSEPRVVSLVRRMMVEAERVAAHFGAAMPVPIDKRVGTAVAAVGHRMSSLQDLLAGRPLELDDIHASFQRMQALSGVPTPLIDDMAGLAALRSKSLALEQQA